MNALRSHEVHLLLEAVDLLYEPVTESEFPHHLLGVVNRLIPHSLGTFDIVHPDPKKCIDVASRPVDPAWQRHVTELMPEHPAMPYLQAGGTEPVIMMTDFVSERQFRDTRFYQELFRPTDQEHQMAAIIPVPAGVGGVALNREIKFTEDERLILQLLRPHIVRAYNFAKMRSATQPPCVVPGQQLTRRETEVLHWMAEGKRDKEIAIILGINWRTVQTHVARILEKLQVETRTAAVAATRGA